MLIPDNVDAMDEHADAITLIKVMGGPGDVEKYCRLHRVPFEPCPTCGPSATNGFRCMTCDRLLNAAAMALKRGVQITFEGGKSLRLDASPWKNSPRIRAFPKWIRRQAMAAGRVATPAQENLLQAASFSGVKVFTAVLDDIYCNQAAEIISMFPDSGPRLFAEQAQFIWSTQRDGMGMSLSAFIEERDR